VPTHGIPIPFLPKYVNVKEHHKVYYVSPKEAILDIVNYSSGAPLSESFIIKARFYIKE